ncbi:hypothetical protein ZWY2020_039355 [Hordeum vulgare]|nr:hypothetical protein ZWY2020_039355 [Hordeum vulgare]
MGRVALAKGTPALPLLRVAKFSPIVYDRALQLPPRRASASPPTPQSPPYLAVPVLPRRDVASPPCPPRPRRLGFEPRHWDLL